MTRKGWTLHEMIISLVVLGGVLALAAHVASGHLRLFREIGEAAALRRQVGQASAVAVAILSHASAAGGDIALALDSAIEIHSPIGTALTCGADAGRVVIPASDARAGNTLAAFAEPPRPGDGLYAFFDDSVGATWLAFHVAAGISPAAGCAHFPGVASVWTLELREQVVIPAGAPLRFTRPIRLSIYRGGDSKWYLGARDWNGADGRFNIVQPVAGPLRPYHTDPDSTGLLFIYRDAAGATLEAPFDPARIASITITARAAASRFDDSGTLTVALRNAQ